MHLVSEVDTQKGDPEGPDNTDTDCIAGYLKIKSLRCFSYSLLYFGFGVMEIFLNGGVINRLFFLALRRSRRLSEVIIPTALLL